MHIELWWESHNKPLGTPRRGWADNIKTDIDKTGDCKKFADLVEAVKFLYRCKQPKTDISVTAPKSLAFSHKVKFLVKSVFGWSSTLCSKITKNISLSVSCFKNLGKSMTLEIFISLKWCRQVSH